MIRMPDSVARDGVFIVAALAMLGVAGQLWGYYLVYPQNWAAQLLAGLPFAAAGVCLLAMRFAWPQTFGRLQERDSA